MATRVFKVGMLNTDTVGDLVSLSGRTSVASRYDTLQSATGTHFSVGASTILYITRMHWNFNIANASIFIGYGDDGVTDSASAPTNPVNLSRNLLVLAANDPMEIDVVYKIPADKFPFVFSGSAGQLDFNAWGGEF